MPYAALKAREYLDKPAIHETMVKDSNNIHSSLNIRKDFDALSTTRSRITKPDLGNIQQELKTSSKTYWSMGSLSDISMADLIKIPEHNNNNQIQNNEDHRLCAEASRNEIEVLKSNVSRLGTQVEMSDLELESLRKQILKENKRGQDMLKKVTELQEEKEALEEERKKDIATMKEFYGELDICMSRKK
uniref:Uncharacterized protein n=2 Tax=Lactuca sativa TaxID=4236 RepID=A0A9R1VUP1_LACSA|nr:hypothetical protein LSAT_V11C400160770 [Lactuca sativa]KAJ0214237.1 hypothetical protein LSAT_V11C400160760 [Lactuca sativa]